MQFCGAEARAGAGGSEKVVVYFVCFLNFYPPWELNIIYQRDKNNIEPEPESELILKNGAGAETL